MQRDADYYRKMCMIKENEVPSQSEITERLGDNISEILFDNCLPALKPFLGLSPPLEGPGPDLWISPSDLLIGKVRLKLPLTSKHIKALTHQGILDIGKDIEKKVENEYDMVRMKALFETEMMLKYQAKKDIRDAVAKVKDEMKLQHDALVEQLKQEFKEELKAELAALTVKLNAEKQLAIKEGKHETEQIMQIKLEMAVAETVQKLTEIFAYELFKQSKKLHQHFWFHIKEEKRKLKQAVIEEKGRGEEKVNQLKAEFECENIANIMYMLATERRRCACEKKAQETNYLARINELEKTLEEQNEALQSAINSYESAGREIKNREAILFQIIKQFQKFIYFALKAVPTQAEYLLNVEKLMILEFTNSLIQRSPEKLLQVDDLIPDYASASVRGIYLGSVDFSTQSPVDLVASHENYHNCGNTASFASEAYTLTEDQDLPYFIFDEKVYMREDFRNMVSQGLKISRSHDLWNFDVEKIIEYIEPEVKNDDNDQNETFKENIESDISISGSTARKKLSNVRFSLRKPDLIVPETEKIIQFHTYDDYEDKTDKVEAIEASEEVTSTADGLSNSEDSDVVSLSSLKKLGKNKKQLIQNPSNLLFVRDSKELLSEKLKAKRYSVSSNEGSNSSNIGIRTDQVKDSLRLKTKKSLESRLSGTFHLLRDIESKIEFARDSKELIKSNLARKNSIVSNSNKPNTTFKNVGIQCNSVDSKTVLITHIEFIPEDGKRKVSEVNFHIKPNIIPSSEYLVQPAEKDPKQPATPTPGQKEQVIQYPQSEFKVVGDFYSDVHTEPQDEFTAKRVSSFIRIFKESPSLMHLFTEACSN